MPCVGEAGSDFSLPRAVFSLAAPFSKFPVKANFCYGLHLR
jgi:hypothetical protein